MSGGDQAAERLELARLLASEVVELRERYRTTVYLRFHEGLKPAAIARRQGVPVRTVQTRLSRALAQLRARLDQRGEERQVWCAALLALAWPRGTAPLLAAPLTATLGGGIAVKKALLAAVLLVAAALTWQGVRSGVFGPRGWAHSGVRPDFIDPSGPIEVLAPPVQAPAAAQPREALPEFVPVSVPSGSLRVTLVREADGLPVRELCVDALCLDDPGPRRTRVHVLTDAQGTARFEDLPVGRVRLFLANGGAEDAEVAAGQEREYRFELAAGLEVLGTVVDSAGAPVAGAEIWVQHAGTPEWNHVLARSRADGRFRLQGLEARAVLGARAAGWRPSLQFDPRELPVGPTGAREVTLARASAAAASPAACSIRTAGPWRARSC